MTHPVKASTTPVPTKGRLQARPGNSPGKSAARAEVQKLGLGEIRDGLLHVPAGDASRPIPLVVMLHGAGGSADQVLPLLQSAAAARRFMVLAPDSRARDTWDAIRGDYGPDVTFIDRALAAVFERYSVDAGRIAIAGFSDGASYALSLGLMNGDLFKDILAFSPGFAAPIRPEGKPEIFISHGNKDEILPVDRCGRRLARTLSGAGYDVDYHEFAGSHVVPPDMVEAALSRFLS
jgi:phospholipase/carboxylesterase